MNSVPIALNRISHTRLFAVFALAFFLLISLSIIILFSSLSATPSFENLQSFVLGRDKTDTTDQSYQSNPSNQAVLGASTNIPAFFYESNAQEIPKSYSYDSQKVLSAFTKAQKDSPAFVMKKDEVEAFMVFATGKLGLNEIESAGIIRALNASLQPLQSDYIRLSLVDRKILDQYLPYHLTPNTYHLTRLFFYIENGDKNEHPQNPQLTPIPASGSLELGIIANL